MKKIDLILCVSMALFAPVLVGTAAAQAQWTATSSPAQATIAGGPWTLSQGGTATTGGAYDGPIPYCTPGGSSGGTPFMNAAATVNTFNPYYFPLVVGNGQSVKGYFDYRPKDINEAIVVATSTNAGQTWTFQAMAEQLTPTCPSADGPSSSNGIDDGEGHPTVISYGGSTILYTLDRRTPHADSDGLIVHQILPRGTNALNPLPATSPIMQPPTANIVAGWNFDNLSGTQLAPAASTNHSAGTPAASSLGMLNSYIYWTQTASIHGAGGTGYAVGDTGTFGSSGGQYTVSTVSGGAVTAVTISPISSGYTVGTNYPATKVTGSGSGLSLKVTALTTPGSVDGSNVTKTTLSSDNTGTATGNVAPNNNEAWRVVGAGGTAGVTNAGNGWNLSAPPCTQGAKFMVNTTGFHYIVLQFDWYTTNQGVRDLQALYTTDGSTWTPVGPIQVTGGGSAFNNQITINFHALGITSVENNPNFGVQMVSVYDPDYLGTPAYSIPGGGNVCSAAGTGTYTAASLDTNNQPVQYNNNSGNWRFDEVNVLGTAGNTNPITNDPIINTTGLVNPDGILAVVPNTYPIKVLYISKTLTSDYIAPTNYPVCPASIPNGNFNDDVEVVRIATTSNFVNFTDITPSNTPAFSLTASPNAPIPMVNGLSDPSTISYSGVRWVAPNGTLIPLSNGNWGLFFGGGNCLDGDSDAFHAIMYAESNGSDLTNWTVINGINNPIASIAQQTGLTDPQTGATNVTIPANTPLVGQSVGGGQFDWFSGRVYGPQAIVTSPNTVSLVFSGYNAGFQASPRDYSNYRNIGQVNLAVTNVTLP
jgi:hypothetical protein